VRFSHFPNLLHSQKEGGSEAKKNEDVRRGRTAKEWLLLTEQEV
jgi:hypothetical protein